MTTEQMQVDIDFLAKRIRNAGKFMPGDRRDWGASANTLVGIAYGVPVDDPALPRDGSDLAACKRAFAALPDHRKTSAVDGFLSACNLAVLS